MRSYNYKRMIADIIGIQIDQWTLIFLMGMASAALGLFVASLAYNGYARNDSTPMFYLTVGIVLFTTVPFLVSYSINWLLSVEGPVIVLLVTVTHLLGLLAIFRSFKRP